MQAEDCVGLLFRLPVPRFTQDEFPSVDSQPFVSTFVQSLVRQRAASRCPHRAPLESEVIGDRNGWGSFSSLKYNSRRHNHDRQLVRFVPVFDALATNASMNWGERIGPKEFYFPYVFPSPGRLSVGFTSHIAS